jgi:hypothetical protein
MAGRFILDCDISATIMASWRSGTMPGEASRRRQSNFLPRPFRQCAAEIAGPAAEPSGLIMA